MDFSNQLYKMVDFSELEVCYSSSADEKPFRLFSWKAFETVGSFEKP